jgi:hypothetical protein
MPVHLKGKNIGYLLAHFAAQEMTPTAPAQSAASTICTCRKAKQNV